MLIDRSGIENMAHLEKDPSTKEKLASIVQGFDEFDIEMKRGTRVSRGLLHAFALIVLTYMCS